MGTGHRVQATHRLKAFTLATALLMVAALAASDSLSTLLLLSLAVSLSIMPVISLGLVKLRASMLDLLAFRRGVYGPLVEGESIRVEVEVESRAPLPLGKILVVDTPPKMFRVEGVPGGTAFMGSRGRCVIRYSAEPFIGLHTFPGLTVTVTDPLGLYAYTKFVELPSRVKVKPRLRHAELGRLRRSVLKWHGALTARLRGAGQEFDEVREYASGDDFRRIEWKATARTGKFMVKEFKAEARLRVLFALDATETMLQGVRGRTKLEVSARLIALTARLMLSRGDEVGIAVWDGTGRPIIVPVRGGAGHFKAVLDALSSITPSPCAKREALSELVRRGVERARLRGLIMVIVSDLEGLDGGEGLAHLVRAMRGRGVRVVFAIPSTRLFELEGLGRVEALAYRALMTLREGKLGSVVKALTSAGARVVLFGPHDDPSKLLSVLEVMAAGRR